MSDATRKHILDICGSEIKDKAIYMVSGLERTRTTWWLMCQDRGWCNIRRSGGRLTFFCSPRGPSRTTEIGRLELSGEDLRSLWELLQSRGFSSTDKTIDLTATGEWAPMSPDDRKKSKHDKGL